MPELTVTVRVPWPKHPTLGALERAIFRALMAAGRELLLQAFTHLEGPLVEVGAGARQRRRRRYLITRFGEIRSSGGRPAPRRATAIRWMRPSGFTPTTRARRGSGPPPPG